MLDALAASAARHSRRSIVLSSYYRGELAELRRVSIGPDLVFGRLWREAGCGEVINAVLAGRRFGFDVERAIYLTVLHRLMVSGSDRHASRWHHGFRIPGAEGLTLDHAYLAMAWLGEEIAHGRSVTDAVEEDLYRRRQELFAEVSIAFFDTTSLYFEGAGGETPVVLGMVLDGDDRPFASFLWPGNTADVTRLMPVVQRSRERFGIAQSKCLSGISLNPGNLPRIFPNCIVSPALLGHALGGREAHSSPMLASVAQLPGGRERLGGQTRGTRDDSGTSPAGD